MTGDYNPVTGPIAGGPILAQGASLWAPLGYMMTDVFHDVLNVTLRECKMDTFSNESDSWILTEQKQEAVGPTAKGIKG